MDNATLLLLGVMDGHSSVTLLRNRDLWGPINVTPGDGEIAQIAYIQSTRWKLTNYVYIRG